MDPSQYAEYSKVYDYFSNPELFPALQSLIVDVVVPNLKPNACVTDIGGGTGLFGALLLEYAPSIQLTIVEPSAPMLAIAKNRLGDRVRYCQATIHEALPALNRQDAFIFQRSLYAIYKNESSCKRLFYDLNRKLNPSGAVFIGDFSKKYNNDEMRQYLERYFGNSPQRRAEFLSNWPVFEAALNNFNKGVDSGQFHLFTPDELDQLLLFARCKRIFASDEGLYAYVKSGDVCEPYWLYRALSALHR